MPGIGLAPITGTDMLPEAAAASGINAAANAVARPRGIGLAVQPVNTNLSPDIALPQQAAPLEAPAIAPDAAPGAKPQAESYYDFDERPIQSIGRAMEAFAAGYRGDPSPVAAFNRDQLERQAMTFKTSAMALDVLQTGEKYLSALPADQHDAFIDDFSKRFAPAIGGTDLKPILTAFAKGKHENAAGKIELLKSLGTSPGMLSAMAENPEAADKFLDELLKSAAEAATKEKKPTILHKDDVLLGADNKPIYDNTKPETPKAPTTRTRVDGDKEIVEQFDPAKNDWAKVSEGPRYKPGVTINNNMTDAQATSALYADRATEAEAILKDVADVGADIGQHVKASVPGGNYLVSTDYQKYDQAKRNFITAVLRKESGAVISPDEMKSADSQYFPQPGDSDAVKKQKAANRNTAIQGLARAAGKNYKPQSGSAGGDSPAPPGVDPEHWKFATPEERALWKK